MDKDYKKIELGQDDEFDLGIDVSKLSDAEKPLYEKLNKQVREAYLKKTSSLAENRRKQEAQLSELQQRYAEAAGQLDQVRAWWQSEGQFLTKAEQKQVLEDAGLDGGENALTRELTALRNQFTLAAQRYDKTITELDERNKTLESALRFSNDLFNIRLKHPGADPERILSTAKDKGIQNLELAYKMAYDDELRKEEVDKAVDKARTEERERIQAEQALVETSPTSTRYVPPEEPKSYADASKSLLGELRKSGGLPI